MLCIVKKQLTSFPDTTISMQHPVHWFFSGRIVLYVPMCTAWPLIMQLFIMLYNAELCKYCLLGQMYFVVLHLEIFLWSLPFLCFIARHKTMQLLKTWAYFLFSFNGLHIFFISISIGFFFVKLFRIINQQHMEIYLFFLLYILIKSLLLSSLLP